MIKAHYGRDEYRNVYLRSDEWRKLRAELMGPHPNCARCGKKASDAHHMRYPKNLADTKTSDLLPLCRKCHDFVHEAISAGLIFPPGVVQTPGHLETARRQTIALRRVPIAKVSKRKQKKTLKKLKVASEKREY